MGKDIRTAHEKLWPHKKPVVGVIHLLPLPGSPGWGGSMDEIRSRAQRDAAILQEEGVDGLIMENFRDAPFFPGRVPPETVAGMAAVGWDLVNSSSVPVGVNVLRNDATAALALAAAVGARFIRVNVHTGSMFTDQGLIQGEAHATLRKRRALGIRVAILADVMVKHATPPPGTTLETAARDCWHRGMADGLILTGSETGAPASLEEVRRVKGTLPEEARVWVGSGATPHTARVLLEEADGLTTDAQQALRNVMDERASSTKFILTANDPDKVDPAIRSRCFAIDLADTPDEERSRILSKILKAEGIPVDPAVVLEYSVQYTDIRQLLYKAEASARSHGALAPLEANEGSFAMGWTPAACDSPSDAQGASQITAGESRNPPPVGEPLEVHLWVQDGHSTYRVQFSRERSRIDQGFTRQSPGRAAAPASVSGPHPAAPIEKGKPAKLSRILELIREEPAATERLHERLTASGLEIPISNLYAYLSELAGQGLIASDESCPKVWHAAREGSATILRTGDSENFI